MFDVSVAAAALLFLLPFFCLVAVLIKLDSKGPVFFHHERVGRRFRSFRIYKFRTMVRDAPRIGRPITCGDDPRITRVGRVLRRTKIDELPQLINVLKGEMSIVGPRPEVRQYVECFHEDYREILSVRPGITDPASIKFRNEAALLGGSADPTDTYLRLVLPAKVDLGKQYVRSSSFGSDVRLIVQTLMALCGFRVSKEGPRPPYL
jgi:lipopolysaccharide/colanic/teichoic acid biosynthesis glycosyltransferase